MHPPNIEKLFWMYSEVEHIDKKPLNLGGGYGFFKLPLRQQEHPLLREKKAVCKLLLLASSQGGWMV